MHSARQSSVSQEPHVTHAVWFDAAATLAPVARTSPAALTCIADFQHTTVHAMLAANVVAATAH
jgi:hypothetical protein